MKILESGVCKSGKPAAVSSTVKSFMSWMVAKEPKPLFVCVLINIMQFLDFLGESEVKYRTLDGIFSAMSLFLYKYDNSIY